MKSRGSLSLTQRMALALTGAVTLFVVVLCILSLWAFDSMEDNLVDSTLLAERDRIVALDTHQANPTGAGVQESLNQPIRRWDIATPGDENQLPPMLRNLDVGAHFMHPGDDTWHVLVFMRDEGKTVLLYDATLNERRVHDFALIVIMAGLLCIGLSYFLARSVSRRITDPVQSLTQTLSTWAPGASNLSPSRNDEVGRLIEAFNRMQSQVEKSIAQEKEFSANLNHEIRTPLTTIRTDAELALEDAQILDETRMRLKRTISNVDLITDTLESTVHLKTQARQNPEPVNLHDCLENAWSTSTGDDELINLQLVNQLLPGEVMTVNRYAMQMIMRNLIRNALEHADATTLTVYLSGTRLYFEDNGKGIAQADLPRIFERYYSGHTRDTQPAEDDSLLAEAPQRRGLGLAIVQHICELEHWTIRAESSTQPGASMTRFILQVS
ncbi:sensor histidine kinase [Advenella mimigardefordensis]|uniref:histidine kinase n=1 Tax=Advenella mimigardefordensis (strain DSM 17166 / LMG 22922 / DPN7) TaxID=1247726 RepID=W0PHL0_ADVMD|nr:HAMP domain-containing sensor histidine kinase [Advenella mimigardefordensis]AHG64925.1 putative sensor histidine kinase [Advenella mimigardefordensis DPN7]